jgi:hypothetical protein
VHIGQYKLAGVKDRAVHVGFRREMDDPLNPFIEAAHDLPVTDVAADELVRGVPLHVLEVIEVSGISQLIEVDEADSPVLPEEKMDEVAPDETGPAGDKKDFAVDRSISIIICFSAGPAK